MKGNRDEPVSHGSTRGSDKEPAEGAHDPLFNRRRFLSAGTSALALALIGDKAPCESGACGRSQNESAQAAAYYEPFAEPRVVYSRDGLLSATLRVTMTDVTLREASGLRVEHTRCYNNSVPGPTLKLRPGEELKVRLINELPKNGDAPCTKEHLNRPHCFNTVNIHTHGLHVSPKAPSDDSFLKIEPQSEYEYCFSVPRFHPSGTYWYHGHVHGSTGLQVMNGLAGALIIEDAPQQRIVPDAKDLVWMVQEIMGKEAEKLYACDHPDAPYTVNGRFQPTLRLRPREIQRWRFINATATPGGYMKLQLVDARGTPQELSLIAVDGCNLLRMQSRTEYVLPPGGRADFLAQVERPGQYRMMKYRYQGRSQDQALALIDVAGPMLNMTMPRVMPALPAFLSPIVDKEISRRRVIRFQICPDQARGTTCRNFPEAKLCGPQGRDEPIKNAFLIDGKPYDPDRIDHTVQLGAAEEWEIINETGAEHPFHIHINHFQVVRDGARPEEWAWQDTVSLPTEGSVKIRSRFRTYQGRYLLHCHILLHSDLGMMQNVEVVGDGVEPCRQA